MSRPEVAEYTKNNPKSCNVLILFDSGEPPEYTHWRNIAKNHAKEYLEINFYDYDKPHPVWIIATEEQVRSAIDFAGKLDNLDLIVACAMGISRSSAIAYIISRSLKTIEESIKILKPHHKPNSHIICLGEKLLNLPLNEELENYGYRLSKFN